MSAIQILGINHVPEVHPGDHLPTLLLAAIHETGLTLLAGDLLVITHKIVSKSEGQLVDLGTVEPSSLARTFAERWGKDPRQTEVVLQESARVVRMDRGIIISETHHGFVCANAGVDASNVPGDDIVCLLPRDPDRSAEGLRQELQAATDINVPVIISDSWGRPWREGITNVAIGVAGLVPLADYRGQRDAHGMLLQASVLAIADEIAAAAELVMGKIDACPVAIVRDYQWQAGQGSGRDLIMDSKRDMFR